MAILHSWAEFRRYFSEGIEGGASLTFAASGSTITRASGSFLSAPKVNGGTGAVQIGDTWEQTGTSSNDGVLGIVSNVTSTVVTLSGATLANEGPVAATYRSCALDPDETPRFPYENVRAGSIGSITGMPSPYTGIQQVLTVNAGAADASAGVDEYHWYLSKRTDEPTKMLWTAIQYVDGSSNTFSGSVFLTPTALYADLYSLTVNNEDLSAALRNVHLYCVRVSDGAIQWLDLYLAAQGLA